MKWGAKWIRVAIALGVIAALAIASPVFGVSVKKLVKKEVAKQIGKARGPAGTPGAPGASGAAGAAGTARAYARVTSHIGDACTPQCTFARSKGITSVTRAGTGSYCVTAPGISAASTSAAVTVDNILTADPQGNASAMANGDCGGGEFAVITERQPVTAVRNAADTGSVNVAGNAAPEDDVGFTIVIP